MELTYPLGQSKFDLCLRGLSLATEDRDYDELSMLCIWRPFSRATISPFVGAGPRYETVGDDSGMSLCGRIGILFDLGNVFIAGEYIMGGENLEFELIFDISFYVSRRIKAHAFLEIPDFDNGVSRGCCGGGLSFDF